MYAHMLPVPGWMDQPRRTAGDAPSPERGAAVLHWPAAQSADRPAPLQVRGAASTSTRCAPTRPADDVRTIELASHAPHPGAAHQAVPRGARAADLHHRRTQEPAAVLRQRPGFKVGARRRRPPRLDRLGGAGPQRRPHRRPVVDDSATPRRSARGAASRACCSCSDRLVRANQALSTPLDAQRARRLRPGPAPRPRGAAPGQPGEAIRDERAPQRGRRDQQIGPASPHGDP